MGIEIKTSWEELRGRRLMVATPMFGGMCQGIYTRSIAGLSSICAANGIHLQYYFLFNESLIQRARAYAADEFMRSDCTHFLFLDADIGFNPNDVIAMLALQDANPDNDTYDVLCAPYPKKNISWEKIKLAVDKGFADEDPNVLENFVGDYVFNPANGTGTIKLDEPAEILEAGTGFMMIRRNTFEKFSEAHPELSYKPDHVRTEHFDGSREITMFFDTPICPDTKRYLSEDYAFCQRVRKLGMHVWLCPWMQTQHVGTYIFGGSLSAIAAVGASATCDPNALKKKK